MHEGICCRYSRCAVMGYMQAGGGHAIAQQCMGESVVAIVDAQLWTMCRPGVATQSLSNALRNPSSRSWLRMSGQPAAQRGQGKQARPDPGRSQRQPRLGAVKVAFAAASISQEHPVAAQPALWRALPLSKPHRSILALLSQRSSEPCLCPSLAARSNGKTETTNATASFICNSSTAHNTPCLWNMSKGQIGDGPAAGFISLL